MNIFNNTKILAFVAVSTVLGGCASMSGDRLATSISDKQVATIQGIQPAINYPLYSIGLSQEARIIGIDGQYNQAQFSARVLSGAHTLIVQTACRFQMQETRNEVSIDANLQAGRTYQLVLDADLSSGCSPKLVQLGKG